LGQPGEAVVLPADFSPAFRDVVSRCLSLSPQDRPSVAELAAFARGQSAQPEPAATVEIAALAAPEPEPQTPEPAPPTTIEVAALAISEPPVALKPAPPAPPVSVLPNIVIDDVRPAPPVVPPVEESPKPRTALTVIVAGALVILALAWASVRVFTGGRAPAPLPPPPAAVQAPIAPAAQAPAPASSAAKPARSEWAAPPVVLHEVMPDVSAGARRTIRGHIKVWVRVIVNQDGSVFAATMDRSGPSRYFQRLALEAAKKWTFSPTTAPSQRLMQVRFDLGREGTTGRAVPLH
jgi:TonB family protein